MSEKQKVVIVNAITGTRFIGALLLPFIVTLFGPLKTAVYIGTLWASDAVDGYLAKHKWHVSTIFGANLDAFCDKVLGIATLAYLYNFYPIMLFSIISELTIFGVNWHYGKKGADVKSSKIGKFKSGVLYISTVLAIISTLSLTSSLAVAIPYIMTITTAIQVGTLYNYIVKNKKSLKKHKSKKDVSNLGLIETLKEIFRLLKEPKLYSPAYYKEHQNESLLDTLYNESDLPLPKLKEEDIPEQGIDNNKSFTPEEIIHLKDYFNFSNKEIKIIEQQFLIDKDMSYDRVFNFFASHPELCYPESEIFKGHTISNNEKIKTKNNRKQ